MERVTAKYGSDTVRATRITLRAMAGGPNFVPVEDDTVCPDDEPRQYLDSGRDAAIALKNAVVKGWDKRDSEDIVSEIDYLFRKHLADLSPIEAQTQTELCLLRALALQRGLSFDLAEAEKAYHRCRSGQFQLALVLNNLGVIQAKRQRCKECVELLTEAIQFALAHRVQTKAPFYNFALIMEQLLKQRLIFVPHYLLALDNTNQLLDFVIKENRSCEEVMSFKKEYSKANWTENEIEAVYKKVAIYGHDKINRDPASFFEERALFLDPERDLFKSFGDVWDKWDRATAQMHFQQAVGLAEEGKFAESLELVKIASAMDPDLATQAEQKADQVGDLWKKNENEKVRVLLNNNEFDAAAKTIKYPPHGSLKRRGDQAIVDAIRRQGQMARIREADGFALKGEKAEAEAVFLSLLAEEMDDDLRKLVSHKLTELRPYG